MLMTAIGQLQIKSVKQISPDSITEKDALAAGYTSRNELISYLNKRTDGAVYRIELGDLGQDPRILLRESKAASRDLAELKERLQRMDNRAGNPWTIKVLQLIKSYPAVRAADLCQHVNQEKMEFKNNVRKLKNLGLTESLETGYRISPRGISYLDSLD